MNLYLVQHGEAVTKDIDPDRPLSQPGRLDIARMAQFAAKNLHMDLSHVHHSGKLRARQTADMFATSLGLPGPLEIDGLAPMDDPSIWTCRPGGSRRQYHAGGPSAASGKTCGFSTLRRCSSDAGRFSDGGNRCSETARGAVVTAVDGSA